MIASWLEPLPSGQRFSRRDAAHLLWRTQCGASAADIDRAVSDGPAATVDRLLAVQSESDEFTGDDATLRRLALDSGNPADLKAWWAHRLLESANPLAEKLTLFWHGHFATSHVKVRSSEQMLAQNELFRRHAWGSFRELLHGVSRDVAMLVWLDSNSNRVRHANENFARELFELFALGVGHYSEQDIQQAARAFTGWHVRKDQFWFNKLQHDTGEKTVFGQTKDLDGDDVVELSLEQPAAARFLAGKLLRFFVSPTPPDAAVDEVAAALRASDYQLQPVLRQVFTSAYFYSPEVRRSIIKSPADLLLGAHRALESRAKLQETTQRMAELGQDLFAPPTVEGWTGGRLWINSATLLARANFAADLALGDRFGSIASPVETAAKLGWTEPSQALDHYGELLLASDLGDARPRLEQHLRQTSGGLELRLRGTIHSLLTMPEYQLM
ncbi:MAG: DUF1800 domain-containing protein [Pirellulales bacterium]